VSFASLENVSNEKSAMTSWYLLDSSSLLLQVIPKKIIYFRYTRIFLDWPKYNIQQNLINTYFKRFYGPLFALNELILLKFAKKGAKNRYFNC